MTLQPVRDAGKVILSRVPHAAAFYQDRLARGGIPSGGYDLDRLTALMPDWVEAANRERGNSAAEGRRILIIASLKWWLEHAVALGLLLLSEGHDVDLAYLPYRRWSEPVLDFDRQRQSAYLSSVLSPLEESIGLYDLSDLSADSIPGPLLEALNEQSVLDVQYTLQRESIDFSDDPQAQGLLELRLKRNLAAAGGLLTLLRQRSFESILVPNGSILEFGVAYRTAQWADVPVVTYEFGEQVERIWLAQNQEVMRLPTDDLWAERGPIPLTETERSEIEALYQARRGGQAWSTFARRWQKSEGAGAARVRRELGLDSARPIVLLCTNVVGDSLALDRQVFTDGMEDWLAETVRYFAGREDCQLVVRVHPGELLGAGHPSTDIVRGALPEMADSIKTIPPDSDVNTYDLIEIAHLGLAYTTTVGMEMAMFGVPVIVAGDTHYRGKGFTDDPASREEYLAAIEARVAEPAGRKLPQRTVDLAWRYAHRFFFEFPFAFPWHLITFWDDIAERPFDQVISDADGAYERALNALAGSPIDWSKAPEPAAEELLT